MPSDPMVTMVAIVRAAAPQLTKVVVGPARGGETPPFAVIRHTGGPEAPAQVPESRQRIDINVYSESVLEANDIQRAIFKHIQSRTGTRDFPSLFSELEPIDLLDDDRRLPYVFRSYYVKYGNDQ